VIAALDRIFCKTLQPSGNRYSSFWNHVIGVEQWGRTSECGCESKKFICYGWWDADHIGNFSTKILRLDEFSGNFRVDRVGIIVSRFRNYFLKTTGCEETEDDINPQYCRPCEFAGGKAITT
jgi:hypothetical protein